MKTYNICKFTFLLNNIGTSIKWFLWKRLKTKMLLIYKLVSYNVQWWNTYKIIVICCDWLYTLQFHKIFQRVENGSGYKVNIVVRQVSEILHARNMINITLRRKTYVLYANNDKFTYNSVRLIKFLNVSLCKDNIRLVLKSL